MCFVQHVFKISTLLVLFGLAFSQTNENVTLIGRWPDGPCYDVFIVDSIAYFGNGGALEIFDVSDVNNPVRLGRAITSGTVYRIFVVEHYAYLALKKGGLEIINISDPRQPQNLGFINTEGFSYDVFVLDGYAYLAADAAGLHIIDIQDPSLPVLVSTFDTEGYTDGIYVCNDYAYISDWNEGVRILDVSDPFNPTQVGRWEISESLFAFRISVAGDRAYVASTGSYFSYGGLHILDINNPEKPEELGFISAPGDWSAGASDVFVADSLAFIINVSDVGDGFMVIDIHDPTTPTEVGRIETMDASGVFVSESKAYIADGRGGFRIFGVDKPATPQVLSVVPTASLAIDVAVADNFAYVADYKNGLYVIDISEPNLPRQLGHFGGWIRAQGVFVAPPFVYIANSFAGLHILDISNPHKPREVGKSGKGLAWDVHVLQELAFVVCRDGCLQIFDVSNPAFPVEIGSVAIEDKTRGVFATQDYAYVAAYKAGLLIFDVRNPMMPTQVGAFVDTLGTAYDVVVHEDVAYVTFGRDGFKIIDVNDPKFPTEIGAPEIKGFAHSLALSEDKRFAYVTDLWAGLQVIDISDPERPVKVGFYKTGDFAYGVSVADDKIFVVDGSDGLFIFQNDLLTSVKEASSPTIEFVLHQNYPNPFNPATEIEFELSKAGQARLTIYNLIGQQVQTLLDGWKQAGNYRLTWDGKNAAGVRVSSGVYIYELKTGGIIIRKKLVLVR